MDVEISAFNPFTTGSRGPWCDVRTRYVHYGPHNRNPPLAVLAATTTTPDTTAWSTPRSHRCGTACFTADVDVSSLTAGVAVYVDIEEPSRPAAVDRCYPSAPLSPRRTLPKPRSLFDICEGDSTPDQKPRRFAFEPPRSEKTRQPTTYAFEAFPVASRRPKRARPVADVDGPHTASLSCKKRRLRLELITSPLSQPFSLPATHILNREAVAAGDKRFLKMAAHVEMARRGWGPGHHAPTSSLKRFAVLNKTRATLRDCSWTELGRYLSAHRLPAADRERSRSASPTPTASRAASTLQLQVHAPKAATAKPPIIPPLKVQSLPIPPSCDPTTANPTSPPLGRSAETGERDAVQRSIYDDEDYCESFPDTRYDSSDDSDDVYSDFSAIFGSEANRPADDAHLVEDYLDELDGISWAVR